ncbi:MAG: hypothetical protein WCF36_01095 [Candidatus Nanopelagicales bacterium]
MKRSLFGGLALALVAYVAVYLGDALNLGLPNPLLGVAAGGVLALAPGGHRLGRLGGFLVGVVLTLIGYGVNAQFMPASSGGVAVTAALTFALATGASALSMGRMPLWSVLLGVAGFAGAYDFIYDDKPYDFLNSSVQTLGTFLVVFGLGYLAAALVDLLFPEVADEAEPVAPQARETVGSEF